MAGSDHLVVGGDVGDAIVHALSGTMSSPRYRVTRVADASAANMVFANGVCVRRCVGAFAVCSTRLICWVVWFSDEHIVAF
jgi:hypothetical protein